MKNYRLKTIWYRMKDRCYNENHISFKYYGGRGITICNDWFNNFDLFEAWALDNNYQSHLTLDRKDTNGNYEPSNCAWATKTEQQRNRRDNKRRLFNYKMMTAAEISEITGRSYGVEYNVIYRTL